MSSLQELRKGQHQKFLKQQQENVPAKKKTTQNSKQVIEILSSDDEDDDNPQAPQALHHHTNENSDAAFARRLQQQLNNEEAAFKLSQQQQDQQLNTDAAYARSLQRPTTNNSSNPISSSLSQQQQDQQLNSDAAYARSLQSPTTNNSSHPISSSSSTSYTSLISKSSVLASQTPETAARTTGLLELITSYYQKSNSNVDKTAQVYISTATASHFHQVLNPNGGRYSRNNSSSSSSSSSTTTTTTTSNNNGNTCYNFQKGNCTYGNNCRYSHSSNDGPRSDGYSCGYRSMQMVCSALLKTSSNARSRLFGGSGYVPKLEDMKAWVENAWAEGWDPDGCATIPNGLIGTREWVGTTECWALLNSFGINAEVVSFKKTNEASAFSSSSSSSKSNKSNKRKNSKLVSEVAFGVDEWLKNYFGVIEIDEQQAAHKKQKRDNFFKKSSSSSTSTTSTKIHLSNSFPLYMQHNGHSRVVVGIVLRGNVKNRETQLLVFDPATYGPDLKTKIQTNQQGWHTMLKRGLHTLRKPEYEFVVVKPFDDVDPHRSKKPNSSFPLGWPLGYKK